MRRARPGLSPNATSRVFDAQTSLRPGLGRWKGKTTAEQRRHALTNPDLGQALAQSRGSEIEEGPQLQRKPEVAVV